MSISKQEAERCYPTQYWNGKSWPLKLLPLTTDELQLAYQSGREAEPCKEQVEAVARTLAVVNAYTAEDGYCYLSSLDKALAEGEEHWSYISGDQRDALMEVAKRLLDVARKAVM